MRIAAAILFFTVASAGLAWAHYYLWSKLVRDTGISGWPRRAATTLFAVGFAMIPITMVIARLLPRGKVSPAAVPAFLWMGVVCYLLLFVVLFDSGRWITEKVRAWNKETPDTAPDEARRTFLKQATAGAAVATTAGFVTYGVHSAVGDVTKPIIEVKLPRLPKALDGFRIVQLSDMHIGSVLGTQFLNYVVEQANAQKPDLVAITGDLVDAPVSLIGNDIALLRNLKSRHGTYFVTGNHEYYSKAGEWVAFLEKLGIRVLLNKRVSIGDSAASFDLAGIPDDRGGWFDEGHAPNLAAAVADRDPDRELVLLAHRPTAIKWAEEHGVGLQLSGHTHGGQFFPLGFLLRILTPYVAGHHHHNDLTQIYVSRGTGFWGPPMRVGSPAEITTIVLTS